MKKLVVTVMFILSGVLAIHPQMHSQGMLHLQVYVADSSSYCVTSTLIAGQSEAILVDAQYHLSEAAKLADQVSAAGKRLKAIIISHPDADHYMGMALWKKRFPETPIYMSANALHVFKRTSARYLKSMQKSFPAEAPDSLPTPELLPSTRFTVDGEQVEIVPDVQGDTWAPSNSYVWIPSLRAVVAGDIVFNGVHVWLANSTPQSRTAWLKTLNRLETLNPKIVVAGHKWSETSPDAPDAITATRNYIKAFDEATESATGSDDLIATMKYEFKPLELVGILTLGARRAIPDLDDASTLNSSR